MLPEVSKFLFDVVSAADKVARFTSARTLEDYVQDELLRSAVERQLFVAGEAVTQALRLDPTLETAISDVQRIKRFRNLLAHAYFAVKHEVVWEIATNELPTLRSEVKQILGQ
jgi:uncharacterized protein with HEPN domain